MSWLEVEIGKNKEPIRADVADGLVIGRSEECDLILNDPSVSAKHAWIRPAGNRFVVVDLRSTNGVTLNGHRVREAVLHDGDRLVFGDVAAVFHDPHQDRRPPAESAVSFACPGCGHPFVTWGSQCPNCGLQFTFGRGSERHRVVARLLSSLSFAGGLAGPLLLGVGWMLGIVLGVTVLSGYTEDCERKDVLMARRGILLGLLWLTLIVWGLRWWAGQHS